MGDPASSDKDVSKSKAKWMQRMTAKALKFYNYCAYGVWEDTRRKFSVNLIKTLNITVKSFLNTDIQTQACAMTYRTLLALVPALALLFAIGRGFGLQDFLQDELLKIFPSQQVVINRTLTFVDSYLNQASEGIFVGVGIVFLLYTVISLLINVEDSFNLIWNVRQGRSFWRKITDYTAMLLILPVLMICGGGLTMFLSTTLQSFFHWSFMTPILSALFEFGSFLFSCLFFAAAFMMIPNTKVKFQNALLAGLFTGVGFQILQWLFVTGQLYVAKYNAIYGSFSFLPLLLIWLQFVWVICLTGSLLCYASQNIFQFTFSDQINHIAPDYSEKLTIAVAAIIVQQFVRQKPPMTVAEISKNFELPSRLITDITNRLCDVNILSHVVIDEEHNVYGLQPAVEPNLISINYMRKRLNQFGTKNFIPNFNQNFAGVIQIVDTINQKISQTTEDILLKDLKLK